uniref:Uncharacterized protein n=1 Tax=Octopus bimaculoides TaxID=37653 RepID=A0A0L8HAU4_OCTBM
MIKNMITKNIFLQYDMIKPFENYEYSEEGVFVSQLLPLYPIKRDCLLLILLSHYRFMQCSF